MAYQNEIIRGVRLAAILFAALLLSVTVYRVVHITPAPAATGQPPAPAPIASVASVAPDSPAVALPPVAVKPQIARHPRRHTSTSAPAPPASMASNRDLSPAAEVEMSHPVVTPELARPAVVVASDSPEEGPAKPQELATPSSTPENSAPRITNRKRSLLRAVGRMLHIGGKKDVPAQAVTQP